MYEFRKASNDFKFQMEEELRISEEADRKKKEEAGRQQAMAAQPGAAPTLTDPVEDPTVERMPEVRPPRMTASVAEDGPALTIQPPSTGETVAARGVSRADAAEPVVEANFGAEDAVPSEPASPSAETVTQHG